MKGSGRQTDTRERGAAAVLAVAVAAVCLMVAVGGYVLGGAVVASHRARLTADLAALAAASALRDPAGSHGACPEAARVAAVNDAVLDACETTGVVVTIEVRVNLGARAAVARARAGPEGAR